MSLLRFGAAATPEERHRNVLIAGGTNSGKTTLANALLKEITDRFPTRRRGLARYVLLGAALAAVSVLLPDVAFAAPAGGGAAMPWTGPLQSPLSNLSGPTARILGALAFVVGGAMWAFTRHEERAKRFGQAIVGIAVTARACHRSGRRRRKNPTAAPNAAPVTMPMFGPRSCAIA